MKVLVIGTSNCLLNGGIKNAIEETFGSDNVTNLSLGATSGTDLALFRLIEGLDLAQFDYVFFDSMINETWQVVAGRSIDHLWKIARMLYSLLPAGITYCYLAFSTKLNFFYPNNVERVHRELCREFGVNFISFREIFIEIACQFQIPVDRLYQDHDVGHFRLALIRLVALETFKLIDLLPKKLVAPTLSERQFFVFDLRLIVPNIQTYSTTLRTQAYAVLDDEAKIDVPSGSLIGFDFTEIATASHFFINAEVPTTKLLSFDADRPWMRVTSFHDEVITNGGSYLQSLREPPAGVGVEYTEANRVLDYPLSGIARIANLYFAREKFDNLLAEAYRPGVLGFASCVSVEEPVSLALRKQKDQLLSAAYFVPS
jgi:hypothetical protein